MFRAGDRVQVDLGLLYEEDPEGIEEVEEFIVVSEDGNEGEATG